MGHTMDMITLVIADDQPAVREGLRMRLGLEADIKVIGEARDGKEALDVIPHLRPDIVLMDMEMPELDGLTATRALRTLAPEYQVIILTIHDDETSRRRAHDSGAAAFVSKLAEDNVLLHTIRAVNSSRVMKTGENSMFTIRFETPEDTPAIRHVNELAFGRVNEADLVDRLRCESAITLSLVAVQDEQVVGHVLISPVTVHNEDSQWDAVALGPMAVLLSYQKQGVGSALIRAAFDELKKIGQYVVIVLGHPEYYPRLGFVPSRPLGIRWEIDVPEEVFMVAELRDGALNGRTGVVRYHPAFSGV
jgi:putative acetyltransferase